MNEAVTADAAITGAQVRDMMTGQLSKIVAKDTKGTTLKIDQLVPWGKGEGIMLLANDMYEFDKGEEINLTIPGCKVKNTYGIDCYGNIVYKVTCTYGGRKGPDDQLLKIHVPNRRIPGCAKLDK